MTNKQVIICIGIEASGKSFWAHRAKKGNPGITIIERDEIREELFPNYNLGTTNKGLEHRVTEIARARLKYFLKNADTNSIAIIADTNLDEKHLAHLIKRIGNKADISYRMFEDSLDLNLCLRRNLTRKRVVSEDVLIQSWKKYMSSYGEADLFSSIKDDIIFVGDIHSQYGNLEKLLKHYEPTNSHLVFLGDINDSRMPENLEGKVSFLDTYYKIKSLVESGSATLIHSNHQKNLINAIRGRRKKLGYGLAGTLAEMQSVGLVSVLYDSKQEITSIKSSREAYDIANWLDSRPYYFIKDSIVGVHAQWVKELCFHPYNVSGEGKQACIYGTSTPRIEGNFDSRVHWWEDYEGKEMIVSGHYHTEWLSDYCAVIDSGCGQLDGMLSAFNPVTKEWNKF